MIRPSYRDLFKGMPYILTAFKLYWFNFPNGEKNGFRLRVSANHRLVLSINSGSIHLTEVGSMTKSVCLVSIVASS